MHDSTERLFLTPGPAQMTAQSVGELATSFGRGDEVFLRQAEVVKKFLLKKTGQKYIISAQGSGSLANQIMVENFLFGRVLVIDTGFYSRRLFAMASRGEYVTEANFAPPDSDLIGKFDWVLATPVETGKGYLIRISALKAIAENLGAKLALDGVASVGLEAGHELADVVGFSSCKGLFGLTGGCFVASKEPPKNLSSSFYMNYETHERKSVTGPYSQLQSIFGTISGHPDMVGQVQENKQILLTTFSDVLIYGMGEQSLISTAFRGHLVADIPLVRYEPRDADAETTVVSALGYLQSRGSSKNPYSLLKLKEPT